MQIKPCADKTEQHRTYEPGPVNDIFKKQCTEIDLFFGHLTFVPVFSFFLRNSSFYFKILNNRLAIETRIEVAENHKLVLVPISELRAFALLGVT